MTISRVIVRLEVNDNCEVPQYLNYCVDTGGVLKRDSNQPNSRQTLTNTENLDLQETGIKNKEAVDDSLLTGNKDKEKTPDRLSYAAALANPYSKTNRSETDLFRGRREYQSISIQTYVPMAAEIVKDLTEKNVIRKEGSQVSETGRVDAVEEVSEFDVYNNESLCNKLGIKRRASEDDLEVGGEKNVVSLASEKSTKSESGGSEAVREEELCIPTESKGQERVKHSRGGVGSTKGGVEVNTVRFVSGNPSVELTEGILHLYKENHFTPLSDGAMRSEMICLLNVPATLTTQDLLLFLSPVHGGLEHIKIIRGNSTNEYMLLVKFNGQANADDFYKTYNNQPFNSIEPEICHMAYVARVESTRSSEGGGMPISGATELPVCTVCLERMDESVDCILTILCNHSFHSNCLTKWDDTSCPVCRYVQTPVAVADHRCFECGSQENLWMCLICGVVGCGRYDRGHAYLHFKDTAHTYSMQLGSNRVWDYAGDNYVHRLVQNKTDGKLVQVDEGGNEIREEKMDSLALEYTYLLTSQLEAQRLHFEDKLEQVELHNKRQIEEIDLRMKALLEESSKKDQQVSNLIKEKQVLDKRCQLLQTKVNKLTSEVSDERQLNECLGKNQTDWQSKVSQLDERLTGKDKEILELQDQLRDVMFYLEAKQTLSNTADISQSEIQEGQIVVNSPAGATGGVGSPADGAQGGSGAKKIRRKPR